MNSKSVKMLSYAAFGAGVASIVISAALRMRETKEDTRNTNSRDQFVGLWAPTFFILAEMFDRISIEDRSYLGVPIEHRRTEGVAERIRETVGAR